MGLKLPAGFNHAGNLARGGVLAQAYPAHFEFPVESFRSPADRATIVLANLKFRFALGLYYH